MKIYSKLQASNITMIFFLFILVFDFLIFLLSGFSYYFTFIKSTNNIIPTLLLLVAFYAVAKVRKIEQFWVITVTMIAFILLACFSLTNNSYTTIESPTSNTKVTVGHRDITLGETNHFYNIYLHTSIPGLMKKVNEETIHIMTSGRFADNLEVLGVYNAEWINDNRIIFHSPYVGEIQVDLKS